MRGKGFSAGVAAPGWSPVRALGLSVLGLLAAVMVAGAVGSGAWFTDAEGVSVASSSARLDIEVRTFSGHREDHHGDGPEDGDGPDLGRRQDDTRGPCSEPESVSDHGHHVSWNLSRRRSDDHDRGLSQVRCVEVATTADSLPVKYRFRATSATGDGRGFRDVEVLVAPVDCGVTDADAPAAWPVYRGPLSGLDGSDVDGAGNGFVHPDGSWNGPIATGDRRCYLFDAHVPPSRGRHDMTDQAVGFDLTVDATQVQNPGF